MDVYTTKLVVFVQYFENELLQIRNVIVDRCLNLKDILVVLYNAEDYTKFIVIHGRGSVQNLSGCGIVACDLSNKEPDFT